MDDSNGDGDGGKAVRENLQSFGVPQSLLQCSVVTSLLTEPSSIEEQILNCISVLALL